jgi:AcrR family transcriptional regulator
MGYADVSVAHIAARARVSRRTFYDLFASREECLLAVLQDAAERVRSEILAEDLTGLVWRERVREGLLRILSFLDREPVLARVCVVSALQGGTGVLVWREELFAELTQVLDQGRQDSARSRECTVLTAEGLVGATFAILHARLLAKPRDSSLRDLLGELMSLIVLPYQGPAVARQERRRSAPSLAMTEHEVVGSARGMLGREDPLRGVPMRLTYRTARVLQAAAGLPGESNRRIGEEADMHDQGQISKLLARLQRLGLLANTGGGHTRGEPNAWRLTPLGESVIQQLNFDIHHPRESAA